MKLTWWDTSISEGIPKDIVRITYEVFSKLRERISRVSTLLLVLNDETYSMFINSNLRNTIESLLNCEVVLVSDVIDAIRVLKYVLRAGKKSVAVSYIAPNKGYSLYVFSRKCKELCFDVKYLDIKSIETYYIIDKNIDTRSYYDFLSDLWIKELSGMISSNLKPDKDSILIGYSPTPRIILKVGVSTGLKLDILKQVIQQIAKMPSSEGMLTSLIWLGKVLNNYGKIIFLYLSPFLDKAVLAYLEREK